METNPKDPTQLKLRLPMVIKEELRQSAKRNHRTMNSEILARLEQSKTNQPQGSTA